MPAVDLADEGHDNNNDSNNNNNNINDNNHNNIDSNSNSIDNSSNDSSNSSSSSSNNSSNDNNNNNNDSNTNSNNSNHDDCNNNNNHHHHHDNDNNSSNDNSSNDNSNNDNTNNSCNSSNSKNSDNRRPREGHLGLRSPERLPKLQATPRLRDKRISTSGVTPKVMFCLQLGEKGTPWHFWEYKSRLTGVPKKSLSKNMKLPEHNKYGTKYDFIFWLGIALCESTAAINQTKIK